MTGYKKTKDPFSILIDGKNKLLKEIARERDSLKLKIEEYDKKLHDANNTIQGHIFFQERSMASIEELIKNVNDGITLADLKEKLKDMVILK